MKIIMSVDRTNKSDSVNVANRALFKKYLDSEGYIYELAKGCYKEEGQNTFSEEQSYIIDVENDWFDLKTLAKLFEQDSILLIDNSGMAFLREGAKHIVLGKFTHVSEVEAKANGCYTETKTGFYIAK